MKLSRDASSKVSAWNPATLDDQPARTRIPNPGRAGGQAPNPNLAASLFAPALGDDLTPREMPPASGALDLDEPELQPSETRPQNWLVNNLGQPGMMEDCSKNWIPGEFALEPVGVDSPAASPDVETIREAALSVARAAVLETMRQEAEQILEQARSQAAEIVMQARSAADAELQSAQQQGLLAARAQTESMLQMLVGVAAETQAWQENLMRRSERLALSLVQDIAARLFGDGFVLDPATLGLAFERALTEAKSLGDLRIRVHPGDLAMLGELWPAHQTALRGQRIEMIPDVDIQRGGCFIDGQFGSVDGRVDAQMRVIQERLGQELADSERPEKAFTPLSPEELAQ